MFPFSLDDILEFCMKNYIDVKISRSVVFEKNINLYFTIVIDGLYKRLYFNLNDFSNAKDIIDMINMELEIVRSISKGKPR